MREKLAGLYRDSLFRNSFFLMFTSAVMAVFGFVFWLICARFYSPAEIGLATSLLSGATLASAFGMLGFNNVLIRFLAGSDLKDDQVSTALILTNIATAIAGAVFLGWAFLSHYPSVESNHPYILIASFIAYVLGLNINTMTESAFVAYRRTGYIVAKNFILSVLKLALVFAIVGLGFVGMISVTAIATLAASFLGITWLIWKFNYRPRGSVNWKVASEIKGFIAGNYVGSLFGALPSMTLSLIAVARLGAQAAGFFYVPSMIVAFLNVIPGSAAQSFFAEASHDETRLEQYFKNAVKHLFALLVPCILGIFIFGHFVLGFFGPGYAEAGTGPLFILSAASLIGAANYLGDTLLNIKKKPGRYLFMNILNAAVIVIPAYIFAPHGLMAMAWVVLAGQLITAIVYLFMQWRLVMSLRTKPQEKRI